MPYEKKIFTAFLIMSFFFLKESFATLSYDYKKPSFGLQFTVTPEAFAHQQLSSLQGSYSISGFETAFDYQPSIFQNYGILGLGAVLGIYPFLKNSNLTNSAFSIWSWGGRIQYQARYFHRQPLVPILGYEAYQTIYRFTSELYHRILMHGPKMGLWFFLNILDPNSATSFYLDKRILRTYLLLESLYERGNNNSVSIRGWTYKLGLRVEF
jgi:hypothetical protein